MRLIHAETHNNFTYQKTNKAEIAALFYRWNAALATLDPNDVTAQYAEDGVLMATPSDKPLQIMKKSRIISYTFSKRNLKAKLIDA
ncbi:MAG: hypothetical protein QX192_09345 [Methylococcales bacterium]